MRIFNASGAVGFFLQASSPKRLGSKQRILSQFPRLALPTASRAVRSSGGPRWVPKEAKRVGSAAATLRLQVTDDQVHITDVGLVVAPAPGNPTVPRAELWAAVLSARAAPHGSSITLRVDATYVVNGMKPDRQEILRRGGNGDLWTMLIDTIRRRSLDIVAEKVKGHAEKQVLQGLVTLEEFLGNVLADAGAGAAAEFAIPQLAAQDVSQWQGRAFLIARRLAIIEASL